MRKVTVAALAVASLAAVPASAADMPLPSPTPYYPPPVRPAFSWTGCYVGAIVGGGWVDNQFTGGPFMDTAVPGTLPGAATVASLSNTSINLGSGGVLAGGQVGCDVQLGSPFVVGIAVRDQSRMDCWPRYGMGLQPKLLDQRRIRFCGFRNKEYHLQWRTGISFYDLF